MKFTARLSCEQDVECGTDRTCVGGVCARCPVCGTGEVCRAGGCVPTTETQCADGLDDDQDGLIDCLDPDCQSAANCQVLPANCTNGVLDGTETDVDCGGSCGPCTDGSVCGGAADCLSSLCTAGHCAPVRGGAFTQTNWSVHATNPDPALARAPGAEQGWQQFESASPSLTAGAQLTVGAGIGSLVLDTDLDFQAGSQLGTAVRGTGAAATLTPLGQVNYGSGVDGVLVIDGTTAAASTDGVAHGASAPFVFNRPYEVTSLVLQNGAVAVAGPLVAMPAVATMLATEVPGAGALDAGTYTYTVRAYDQGGVQTRTGPEAPVTVADGSAVSLSWAAVPEAAGYRVFRRTGATYTAPSLVCDTFQVSCLDAANVPVDAIPVADGNPVTGGRVQIRSQGAVVIDATSRISVMGLGYAGASWREQGRSYQGDWQVSQMVANYGGGGGAYVQGAGGGAHAMPGEDGVWDGNTYGARGYGGLAYGSAALDFLELGSGGGSDPAGGGPGGGAIGIEAPSVNLNGTLDATGAQGSLHYTGRTSGGGGGGAIKVMSPALTVGPTAVVTAAGGLQSGSGVCNFYAGGGACGVQPCCFPASGNGGGGRVALYGGLTVTGSVDAGTGTLAGTVVRSNLGLSGGAGSFVSAPLDMGGPATTLGPLTLTAAVPAGDLLRLQLASSPDGTSWGSFLGPDCTSASAYGASSASVCASHLGARYLKVKVELRQAPSSSGLALDRVQLGYQTSAAGVLVSSPFDTGEQPRFDALTFSASTPSGAATELQLRTAPDVGGAPGTWTAWQGPIDAASWYTDPTGATPLNPQQSDGVGDRWVQYQVRLTPGAGSGPALTQVRLAWSSAHAVDLLLDGNGQDITGTSSNGRGGSSNWSGAAGGVANYLLAVRNTGHFDDTFQLAVAGPSGFSITVGGASTPPSTGTLVAGGSITYPVQVTVPAGARGTQRVVVSASSLADPAKVDSVSAVLVLPP